MLTEDERKRQQSDGLNGDDANGNADSNGSHAPDGVHADGSHLHSNGNGHTPLSILDGATNGNGSKPRRTRTRRKLGSLVVGRSGSHMVEANLDRLLHVLSALGPELIPIAEVDLLCTRAAQMIAKGSGGAVAIWRVSPSRQEYEGVLTPDDRRFVAAGLYGLSDRLFSAVNQSVTTTARHLLDQLAANDDSEPTFELPTVAAWHKAAPALLPKLDVLAASPIGDVLAAEGIGTVYSLPLLSGRRKLGSLDIYYKDEHQFVPGEQELLEAIAYQTANSMEYSSYQEQAGRKTAEALLLREVSQMINRSLELDETFDAILLAVRRLLYFDAAEITLMNPNGRTLSQVVAHNLQDDAGKHSYALDDSSLTAQLVATRRPVIFDQANEIENLRFSRTSRGNPFQSFIGLPLLLGDNVVGTLELGSERANAFSEDDVRILTNIAEQAATAIENARLHAETTQRNRELSILQEISRNINASLDLNETLKAVLVSLQRLVNYFAGEITIYNSTRNVLTSVITTGIASEQNTLDEYSLDDVTYSSWLGRNLIPLLIRNHAERDSLGIFSNSPIHSFIGVPMMIGSRLVGTIEISSDEPDTFTEADLNILQLVAAQAASAVENAQLYERTDERLSRRLSELTVLQRIGERLNSTFDLSEIFQMVISEAAAATGAALGVICEIDYEREVFVARAASGPFHERAALTDLPSMSLNQGIIGRAFRSGEPMLVSDVSEDPDYVASLPEIHSELAVPIKYETEVVGLINLEGNIANAFDVEHVHFIEALANQAAVAIGNAKIYQEQMRQSEQLGRRANQLNQVLEIGNSITPDRDLDDLMDQVANAIADTLAFRIVTISLVEGEEQQYMRRVASAGVPLAVFEQQRRSRVPLAATLRDYDERFRVSRSYFLPAEEFGEQLRNEPYTITLMDTSREYRLGGWHPEDALFVPLYSTTGDLLGQISVDDPLNGQRPSRSLIEALEVFANQAANAVENAQLFRRYSERITELNALSSVGRELAAQLDSEAMAEAVFRSISPIMPIDAFYIALLEGDQMRTLLAVDKGEPVKLPLLPLAGTLSERVLQAGEAVVLNSTSDDTVPQSTLVTGSGVMPHSWLGVPLRVGDKMVGVLSVQQYSNYAYTNRDSQLLSTIASQLATALDNASLFERNQQRLGELAMLNEIGSDLSAARDEKNLFDLAYSGVIKLFSAEWLTIMSHQPSTGTLKTSYRSTDGRLPARPGALEVELASTTLRTRRPLLVGNLLDPDQLPLGISAEQITDAATPACAWLSVPLVSGSETLGILILQSSEAGKFNSEQVTLLTLFANQFTTAMENVGLFALDEQRITNLGILNQTAQEITANLDRQQIYELVYKDTQLLFDNDSLMIGLYEPGSDEIEMIYVHERLNDTVVPPYRARLHQSNSGRVILSGEPLLIKDADDPLENPLAGRVNRVGPRDRSTRSWMGVPLFQGGQVTGMINVQSYKVNAFNPEQVTLLSTLASQVATALQNASLFERNQQRIGELDLLNNIGRVLNATTSVSEVGQAVYDRIKGSLEIDVYILSLYDAEQEQINLPLVIADDIPTSRPSIAVGNGISGYVIRNRQPLLVADATTSLPEGVELLLIPGGKVSRSVISVPLLVGNQVIGVLSVQSRRPNVYHESDLNLLTTVASQMATALQNASLFERNQRRIQELDLLNQISRTLNTKLTVSDISRSVYDQLKAAALLSVDAYGLILYDERTDSIHQPFIIDRDEVFTIPTVPLSNRLSSYVIRNHTTLLVNDLEHDALPPGIEPSNVGQEEHPRTWLGVPLLIGEQVLGLLLVQSYTPNAYNQSDVNFLSTLANQVATALQNASLFERNQQRIAELDSLSSISRTLTSKLTVDDIAQAVHAHLAASLSVDGYTLVLYNDATRQLDFPFFVDYGRRITVESQPLGSSPTSHVIRTARPLLFNDVENEPLPAGVEWQVISQAVPAHSWLGVPLLLGNRVIGMIKVQSAHVGAYNDSDLNFLNTVASQVATALQNASLFERNRQRISELDSLNNIGRALTSKLDVKEVAQLVYDQLRQNFPLDSFMLGLYDEKTNLLTSPLVMDAGVEYEVEPREVGKTLTTLVLSGRKPVLFKDLENDTLPEGYGIVFTGGTVPYRSWLGVPLLLGERVVGLLILESKEPDRYGESDITYITAIANQTAIALENANLFNQAQTRIDELDSLNELSRQLAASMHIDAVAVLVYDHMRKFMSFDTFMMGLYDDQRSKITWPVALEQGERMEAPPMSLGEGISSWVIQQERPLVISDITDPAAMPAGLVPVHYGGPNFSRSWVGVPMMVGNRLIGILTVQSYQAGQYSEDSIRPLLSVANQAAIAIENARLFNQRERKIAELDTINQMAKEISSSLQTDELMQVIYNQVTQVISTRNFFIALYDDKKQEISYRFMREHGRPVPRAPRKLGSGFVSQIVETRQPLLINYDTSRYATERGWEHVGEAAKSWLGVPMTVGDRVLGVIAVQSYEVENIYTEDDQALLSTVASQAGIAIQNAYLFDEASRRILMLNALNEIGRVLGAVLDEEAVFQKIYEHVSRFFDLSSFYIALYKREAGVIAYPFMVEDEVRIESDGQTTVLGEGLASYVISNRRPLLIDDLNSMQDQYEGYQAGRVGQHDERSWMGVPMFLGGEVIGLISVQSRNIAAYNQEDLQSLGTLAGQAAVAIRNATLFDEIKTLNTNLERIVEERTEALARSNTELTVERDRLGHLYSISHQLSTNLDLEDILERGLRLVAEAVAAPNGSVMVIDPNSGNLVYRAAFGGRHVPVGGTPTPWRPGTGVAGWAVQNRQPLLIPDVLADPRWDDHPGWSNDTRSILSVPLVTGSEVYGVINLTHSQVGYFTDDHLRLVSTVGTEMAIAMHNAELYSLISEQADKLAGSLLVQEQEVSKNKAILESIVDGVVVFDRSNRISLVNRAAEQIMGLAAGQLLGRQIPDDLREIEGASPELLDMVISVVRAAGEGASGSLNLSRRRFNIGDEIVNVNLSPVQAAGDVLGVVAVIRDITREAEIEMEKSQFVSTVSHELRTPMTVIKGNTDLLLMGAAGVLSPMQQSIMQALKRNSERMKTLIDDLLMVSRIETGKIAQTIDTKYYDISEIVEGTISNLRGLANAKEQIVTIEIAPSLPEVKIDRARIEQVMTNLFTNAVKYTPSGGRINVRCFRSADQHAVQVDVQDNGIGISEKDQEKLFTPFYRTENQQARVQEGTGLGLVIARNLVEIQGGQMWLDSTPGEGTTFHFTVPAFVAEIAAAQINTDQPAELRRTKPRILVVDDDPDVTAQLAVELEAQGYEVFKAHDGRAAIEVASREQPDLITMDILMPQMDGFETMRALGEDPNSAGIPIVIISLVNEREHGLALGAVDFLPKPVSGEALSLSIQRVLAPQPAGGTHVLLIDDERDIIGGLEAALREYGFTVSVAYSGEEGLHRVNEQPPDVILLDMKMPGVGGTQVLTTLKHNTTTRNIPVIMLTGSVPLDDARVRLLKLGAEELLSKPFSIGQVIDQIKKVIPVLAGSEQPPTPVAREEGNGG